MFSCNVSRRACPVQGTEVATSSLLLDTKRRTHQQTRGAVRLPPPPTHSLLALKSTTAAQSQVQDMQEHFSQDNSTRPQTADVNVLQCNPPAMSTLHKHGHGQVSAGRCAPTLSGCLSLSVCVCVCATQGRRVLVTVHTHAVCAYEAASNASTHTCALAACTLADAWWITRCRMPSRATPCRCNWLGAKGRACRRKHQEEKRSRTAPANTGQSNPAG